MSERRLKNEKQETKTTCGLPSRYASYKHNHHGHCGSLLHPNWDALE